jgi:hypothetical protein
MIKLIFENLNENSRFNDMKFIFFFFEMCDYCVYWCVMFERDKHIWIVWNKNILYFEKNILHDFRRDDNERKWIHRLWNVLICIHLFNLTKFILKRSHDSDHSSWHEFNQLNDIFIE